MSLASWQLDVLCTLGGAWNLSLSQCGTNAPKTNHDNLCTLANSWGTELSVCEDGHIRNSTSVSSSISSSITSTIAATTNSTTIASSTDSGAEDSTIIVTETAPAVSTATGSASAVPPPATVTSDGADPDATPFPVLNNTAPVNSATVGSTVLILIRQDDNAYSVTSGLDGYGIPYELVRVPKTGFSLPALNTTSHGNYGGIMGTEVQVGQVDETGHCPSTFVMLNLFQHQFFRASLGSG